MKLNIQLFATNLSVGGAYTQAWQSGNTVGGTSGAYKWRIAVNYISRDVAANTSYIRIRFQETGTWGSYSGMNSTYSRLKISLNNGSSYTQIGYKKSPSFTEDTTENKLDVYYTVEHNNNGSSPSIKIQASNETENTASYAPANKTITSDTITLTTIPRESKLGAINDFAIATSTVIPITFTKYVNDYTNKLNVKIGSTTIKSDFTITTPYNLQFTSSEVTAIKNAFSGSSTTITFTLSTYNGSTLIGTSVQTATGIDSSRVMGLSRYKSNSGYKYCINDSLDKTLDDGLQVGGKIYLNKGRVYGSTVLFNGTATTNNITLTNDSFANYTYIDIFYEFSSNNGVMFSRVYNPNGKVVNLTGLYDNNTNGFFAFCPYTISGANMTRGTEIRWRWVSTGAANQRTTGTENIQIFRIEGWK